MISKVYNVQSNPSNGVITDIFITLDQLRNIFNCKKGSRRGFNKHKHQKDIEQRKKNVREAIQNFLEKQWKAVNLTNKKPNCDREKEEMEESEKVVVGKNQ